MANLDTKRGRLELFAVQSGQAPLLWATLAFSTAVNLLQLTGPLYMMQVYDRVLGSQSESTLIALTLLITALFLGMGILEYVRARVLARIGARVQDRLDRRVFAAAMQRLTVAPNDPNAMAAQRDLEAVQRLWASQVLIALFDMPWTPIFILAISIFHPALGLLAVFGGVVLVCVTVLNQKMTAKPQARVNGLNMQAERVSDLIKLEAEPVQALGMTGAAFDRWQQSRAQALKESVDTGDLAGKFAAISKTFRLFLQSAMLGLGAWYVLPGRYDGRRDDCRIDFDGPRFAAHRNGRWPMADRLARGRGL